MITLGELAAEARATAPVRTVALGEIPGRAGRVVVAGAKTA
jgi:hypothetical protein